MAPTEGFKHTKQSLLDNFQRKKSMKLCELRKEEEFCDLILKSEDDCEIRVHKVVVSAASNYFKDLLTTPMKEKYEKCIPLPHITGDVLEKIILFIYTSEFEGKIGDVEKIIKHAVEFQLEELVEICVLIMSESINDHNCLLYWRFGRDNLVYDLEIKCFAYIVGKAEYLFENSFLNDLTMEEMKSLLAEDSLHLQCAEGKIFEFVWDWTAGKVSDTKTFSEVFSEVIDLLHFSKLKDEFILSRILCNENLLGNTELWNKVAKLTNDKRTHKVQNVVKDEFPSHHVYPKKRLLSLGAMKMFTGLGTDETTVETKKILPDKFGWTIFNNNCLLICGGENSKACEFLEPSTLEWRAFPSMKNVKRSHSCSYLDNKIYACGGFQDKSVKIFDLGKEEWYNGPEMLWNNYNFGLIAVIGALYAIGGQTINIAILDPRVQKWSCVNSSFPIYNDYKYTRCIAIGPSIYCFNRDKRHCFDIRTNMFLREDSCADFTNRFNFCELDGYIYGFGYKQNSNKYLLKLVQYHPNGTQSYKEKSFGKYDYCHQTALEAFYY